MRFIRLWFAEVNVTECFWARMLDRDRLDTEVGCFFYITRGNSYNYYRVFSEFPVWRGEDRRPVYEPNDPEWPNDPESYYEIYQEKEFPASLQRFLPSYQKQVVTLRRIK